MKELKGLMQFVTETDNKTRITVYGGLSCYISISDGSLYFTSRSTFMLFQDFDN
jgi:hypothetical protein